MTPAPPLKASPRALHLELATRDPRGLAAEQRRRGATDVDLDYAPQQQSFELLAPPSANGQALGLLVWLSANASGALPDAEWQRVLFERRLAWIGPNHVENGQPSSTRVGLAVDAVALAAQRFSVDPERVFLSGFSGGAKAAFRTLLLYPELFRGAILNCGLDYFRDVPARSAGEGKVWFKRLSAPRDLELAKSRRLYVITGSDDMNRGQIMDIHPALLEDGFQNVEVALLPGMAHQTPASADFARALDWLERR